MGGFCVFGGGSVGDAFSCEAVMWMDEGPLNMYLVGQLTSPIPHDWAGQSEIDTKIQFVRLVFLLEYLIKLANHTYLP